MSYNKGVNRELTGLRSAYDQNTSSVYGKRGRCVQNQSQENQIGSDDDKHENVVSGLAHKIINNTLTQLVMLKNSMDMEEFETVLTLCLKKPIPLNEYFAYSALLIDAYFQNKEKDKLESLIYSLREKFMEQPIVLEQIKFMEEKYLKNR